MKRGNGNSFVDLLSFSFKRHKFAIVGIFVLFLTFFAQTGTVHAKFLDSTLTEFAENNILYYDPCDGTGANGLLGAGGFVSGGTGSCAKLGQLRTEMWNAASEEDKENFMFVVSHENDSLAGVEAYMNMVVGRKNGDLHKWVKELCPAYRGNNPERPCEGSHNISDKEKKWIEKALAGSNITNIATGNASWSSTGGDAGTGGPLTCLWQSSDNEDGGSCKTDVDYSKKPFSKGGKCSEMITAAGGDINSGWECWAWDNTESWSKSMASQCGGYASVGAANAVSSAAAAGSTTTAPSSSVTWDADGWITGGFEGYKKEASKPLTGSDHKKYKNGKPNKIVLHYTQGDKNLGLGTYGCGEGCAAHFTTDLKKKETYQHVPLGIPSGAMKDKADTLDAIQIEIVGYGFQKNNPDNPDKNSKCIIDGENHTSSEYCFAKFGDEEWGYLAELLTAISKWGSDNGANIPLTSSVTWTGNVSNVRLSEEEWNNTSGIVAHMHAPYNDHNDTGNIWPLVSAALGTTDCVLSGDENSIKGAKNAEKQANEVGKLSWSDSNKSQMKKVLENYGDLAYRTGQAYDVPWIAILVQGRYEDPESKCGNNNFWGIKCYPGSNAGDGAHATNVGEGFALYGKTVHNGYHDQVLGITDPKEYLEKLGPTWVQGNVNGDGYGSINDMKKSVDALTKYIESAEGQKVVAAFGAANCNGANGMAGGGSGFCEGDSLAYAGAGNVGNGGDIVANVEYLIDLANKQGANYTLGGSGRSISSYKKFVNEGAPMANIDCTGFASLVYWYTYGDAFKDSDIISSYELVYGSPSSYVEVNRSEVRPGDMFAYNDGHEGHGGIVIEVENGKVTKIAETGGKQGRSGNNTTLGYSGPDDYSVRHMNTDAGHFYRWKGAN